MGLKGVFEIEWEGVHFWGVGRPELLEKEKVAIVGTRRPLKYSRLYTFKLAKLLAQKFVVVSGGAIGIDREAHLGALPNTILISPAGIDLYYPIANRELIDRVRREGLLLSPYPPGFRPRRYTFLERNRIIISMAQWVVIPEGTLSSGSFNSYRHSRELGKEVWTLPHRIGESPLSELIAEEGGRVIWSLEKVAQELGVSGEGEKERKESEGVKKRDPIQEAMEELLGKRERKFGRLL